MSLKIVAALIMTGLIAQSSAFVLKSLREDDIFLPGFSYEKNDLQDKLSMSVPKGTLQFLPFFRNISAWSLLQDDSSSTITQKTSFPVLGVFFQDVQASAGDVSDSGWVHAYLGNTTYQIALTARGDDNQCKLEAKISSPQADVGLIFLDLEKVYNAFNAPAVLKELNAVVWGAIVDELTAILTDLVGQELPRKTDTVTLCKQILGAKPGDMPEPDL